MFGPSIRVFVSATSHDLRDHRRAVEQALLDNGIHPITQEHFCADQRSLTEFLRDEVATCDAVICLVGHAFGAAPPETPNRSYTQHEYDFALLYQKPVFLFLAAEDFQPNAAPEDSCEQLELQRTHRKVLLQKHCCGWFRGPEEFARLVGAIILKIRKHTGGSCIIYLYPPNKPVHFAGRELELAQLLDAFRHPAPAIVAVIGMGGQGKSTLVHRALEVYAPGLFATGFWWSADRAGGGFDFFLDEALIHLTQGRYDKRESPEKRQRVMRLLAILQQKPVVLAIDGIQCWLRGWQSLVGDGSSSSSPDARAGSEIELDDFLSAASALNNGSHLILTSHALPEALDNTDRVLVPVYEPEKRFSLEGLDSKAATGLLRAYGVRGAEDELLVVASQYGNHPLALCLLGAHLKKLHGGTIVRLTPDESNNPVGKLYDLLEKASARLPDSARAALLMSVIAHSLDPAELGAITWVFDQSSSSWLERVGRWVVFLVEGKELCERSLASVRDLAVMISEWQFAGWDAGSQTVTMHPLVSAFFRRRTTKPSAIHKRFATWHAARPIPADASTLDHARHRRLAIEHALRSRDLKWCARLMFGPFLENHCFSEWLNVWGHQSYGVDLLRQLADASGGDLRADYLIARAALLQRFNSVRESLKDADEAITILDRSGFRFRGKDIQKTSLARALVNRGNAKRIIGRSSHALADFDEALNVLAMCKRQNAALQCDVAQTRSNRGIALLDLGHWSKARKDFDSACEIYERLFVTDPRRMSAVLARTRINRGIVLAEIGENELALADFDQAAVCLQRLIESGQPEMTPVLAHDGIMAGTVLNELGRGFDACGRIDGALALLEPLNSDNRKDIAPLIALACMVKAKVCLRVEDTEGASICANRAISTYKRLVADGGEQFAGSLAHAQLIRAEVRQRTGDLPGAATDHHEGFDSLRKLMAAWEGESDIVIVFLQRITSAIQYLCKEPGGECSQLLADLADCWQRIWNNTDAPEAIRTTGRRCLDKLAPVLDSLVQSGGDVPAFCNLTKNDPAR